MRRLHGELERAVGDSRVDRADEQQEVREDREHERVGVGADRQEPRDALVGHDRSVELRRVALGGAHAEGVPVVERGDAGDRSPRVRNPCTSRGAPSPVGLLAEDAEPGPRRGERGEDLGAGEREAAVDAARRGERVPQHEVVARLAVAEREQLAGRGIPQHPVERGVAALGEHPRDPDPDQVHVDAERRRRRVRGEQSLIARGLEQRARREVAGGAQVVEVVGEERVVAVVAGGRSSDAGEQLGGEHGHGLRLRRMPWVASRHERPYPSRAARRFRRGYGLPAANRAARVVGSRAAPGRSKHYWLATRTS